jgi:hypothetical protein
VAFSAGGDAVVNPHEPGVIADGLVVARIMRAAADALEATPWMWTVAFGHHGDRTPTPRLRGDARGRDGGVREELAAGMTDWIKTRG